MPGFDQLFAQHAATAFARQLALADLIGDRDWQLDITAGKATFGDDLQFPIQLLGTESELDGTWLWAWANEASGLPPQVLQLAAAMRAFGSEHEVAELTEPTFPLDRMDGTRLALLASGLTGRGYYRGPYDGGAVFFHLENVPETPVRPERALTVLAQIIQAFPVDHHTLVVAFLTQQGWRVGDEPALVTGRHPDGSDLRITFDELGRIADMSGTVG